ncbi:MAG: septum formation initiator family protein [Bacteroidia bacterium]|nr:septum formation initiator family protein [Bacteroidia bacterium]
MGVASNLFQRIFQRLAKTAGTKYFLVLVLAGIWMLTFDRYNLVSQQRVDNQISQYQNDIAHYNNAIKELNQESARLFSNEQALEQYVREKYYMKKSGEDVFVIVNE